LSGSAVGFVASRPYINLSQCGMQALDEAGRIPVDLQFRIGTAVSPIACPDPVSQDLHFHYSDPKKSQITNNKPQMTNSFRIYNQSNTGKNYLIY
jgi:hypothetical protein